MVKVFTICMYIIVTWKVDKIYTEQIYRFLIRIQINTICYAVFIQDSSQLNPVPTYIESAAQLGQGKGSLVEKCTPNLQCLRRQGSCNILSLYF